jgi:hypothetical protein
VSGSRKQSKIQLPPSPEKTDADYYGEEDPEYPDAYFENHVKLGEESPKAPKMLAPKMEVKVEDIKASDLKPIEIN